MAATKDKKMNKALATELPKIELHLHLDGSLSPGKKNENIQSHFSCSLPLDLLWQN